MSNPKNSSILFFPAALAGLLSCSSPTGFQYEGPFGLTIGGNPPADAVGTQPDVPGDEQPPICDPLGGGDSGGNSTSGLVATLRYFPEPPGTSSLVMDDFLPGATGVVQASNKIFLSRINKITSPFDQGFADADGAKLQAADGTDLIEYFALFIKGDIKLGAGDPAGDYEFAVMSDDGSLVYFDQGDGFQDPQALAIDNDGTHPNKIRCSSQINLSAGERLPMEMGYFQAPRVRISLMLFWRTGSSLDTEEPLCTAGAQGDTYFFAADGTPQAGYTAFLARGWKVLEADNFVLPAYVGDNPCN